MISHYIFQLEKVKSEASALIKGNSDHIQNRIIALMATILENHINVNESLNENQKIRNRLGKLTDFILSSQKQTLEKIIW